MTVTSDLPGAALARRDEYEQMLRAGLLPAHVFPPLAKEVEDAVLERAWSNAASPYGGHRLYVLSVAGSHSRIKIGQTTEVRRRIADHLNEYHVNGHGLVDAWISDPLPDGRTREKYLRALLRLLRLEPGHRREEYPGASFQQVRTAAIVATPPSVSELIRSTADLE
ncbi:GIY-YIG nuclease family protein [Kitasatospora cineracea]|uniref:GIY-YIG nuclease family protein n=1 Tax=Kitasatospora cineracea TaxID=88074 RepID=UPI0036D928EE